MAVKIVSKESKSSLVSGATLQHLLQRNFYYSRFFQQSCSHNFIKVMRNCLKPANLEFSYEIFVKVLSWVAPPP